MKRLGIELLSVFDLNPVSFVELAARLDCGHVSLGLSQFPMPVYGDTPWSLRDNDQLRRELRRSLLDTGVVISLGEGFAIREGTVVGDFRHDLEILAELGAERVNTVAMDCDLNRCIDQVARFAELAAEFGLEPTLEFAPGLTIANLDAAVAAIARTGQHNLRLLLDSMHLFRSGGNTEQVRELDSALIGYVQLSDAPLRNDYTDYMQEATFSRRLPGEGELDLQGFLAALPADVIVSLELPNLARARADGSPELWLREAVTATRKLLQACT